MIPITLPPDMEMPEGQSEVSATIEVVDGEAYIVAINGTPLGESEEGMEEPDEEDMDEADFLSAVERSMSQ